MSRAGVALSGGGSILPGVLSPRWHKLLPVMKGWSPGVATRAGMVGQWAEIEVGLGRNLGDSSTYALRFGFLVETVTACDHPVS